MWGDHPVAKSGGEGKILKKRKKKLAATSEKTGGQKIRNN